MDRPVSDLDWNDQRLAIGTDMLARNWWAVVLRGVAGIIFGGLTLLIPRVTLAALILLFGAYALVSGVLNVVAAVSGRSGARSWWALLLEGLVGVGAGLVTFFMPGLTALALVYVISAWAIITGVLEIVAAVRLRKVIGHEWWLGLSGVVSVAFGVFLARAPGAGALAVVLWIGAYEVVVGVLLIGLGVRLRAHRSRPRGEPARRAA